MVEVPSLSPQSDEEKDNISVLSFSLKQLATYVAELEIGLSLFDFATDEISTLRKSAPQSKKTFDKILSFNRWRVIAARDWCLEIFHFAKTMEGIKELAHATPSINAAIDRERLRSATRLFTQHFRDFEEVRHAVAHRGEVLTSWKENAARVASIKKSRLEIGGRIMKQYGLVWVEDYFSDRTFYNTIDGRVVSIEISSDTIQKLADVKDEFYRSFPAPK